MSCQNLVSPWGIHSQIFLKKGVFKNFANFTEIWWSFFWIELQEACKFIKKKLQHRCFPSKFAKPLWRKFNLLLLWIFCFAVDCQNSRLHRMNLIIHFTAILENRVQELFRNLWMQIICLVCWRFIHSFFYFSLLICSFFYIWKNPSSTLI